MELGCTDPSRLVEGAGFSPNAELKIAEGAKKEGQPPSICCSQRPFYSLSKPCLSKNGPRCRRKFVYSPTRFLPRFRPSNFVGKVNPPVGGREGER
ncbi:hypothetical protein MRX96_011655 [Rhipicephalus microplus]